MMSSAFASSSPLKQQKCVVFGVVGKGNATTTTTKKKKGRKINASKKDEHH